MSKLPTVRGVLLIGAAALIGNWTGDTLRGLISGEPTHRLGIAHTTQDGQLALGVNLVITNFVPAIILGVLAGKPRFVYAFLSGAIISALVGDSYERAVVRWIRER
jgi:hypothetical protein